MDVVDTQLADLKQEINVLKNERAKAKKALEEALEMGKPADIRADLRSLLDSATTELKRIGEIELELIKQKNLGASFSTVPRESFLRCLREAGIATSNPAAQKIIDTIARRYPNHMLAVAGSRDACLELYREVKELPATYTRGVIQNQLNISINGPMPGQKFILTAIDLGAGRRCLIKMLSPPQLVTLAPPSELEKAVAMEMEVSEIVSKAQIPGLVISEVVIVNVSHAEGLSVGIGSRPALKMRHYHSPLTQVPQLSEHLIYREFRRVYSALVSLHALNLVHMDVKSDNVFVDEDCLWNLGDFGSCRQVNSPIWTFTEVFNPYAISQFNTSVIPAMDMVLLCVMICVELKKETWKSRLWGKGQRVQHELIKKSMSDIEEAIFRDEILCLYEESYAKVVTHLQ